MRLPLRFIRPTVPLVSEWEPYLAESYRERIFSNFGPANLLLEQRLSSACGYGYRHVVTVNSCTDGLTAALMAFGVRGAVIVPAFTFAATAHAVMRAGCTPIFCDVDPETWGLSLEHTISICQQRKISAIMPVRVFGLDIDFSSMQEMAAQQDIPMVIDAAGSFTGCKFQAGATEHTGRQGDCEVYSFHATKVFSVGEGGVVLCNPELANRVRAATNFGFVGRDVLGVGMNSKLSEFHAAVALAMLGRIDEYLKRRREVAAAYYKAFSGHMGVTRCWTSTMGPWQTYPLQLNMRSSVVADEIVKESLRRGVEIRRYYYPALTDTTLFKKLVEDRDNEFVQSKKLAESMVCLPVYSDMSEEELDFVICTISELLSEYGI